MLVVAGTRQQKPNGWRKHQPFEDMVMSLKMIQVMPTAKRYFMPQHDSLRSGRESEDMGCTITLSHRRTHHAASHCDHDPSSAITNVGTSAQDGTLKPKYTYSETCITTPVENVITNQQVKMKQKTTSIRNL
jgi:hypothetical protein